MLLRGPQNAVNFWIPVPTIWLALWRLGFGFGLILKRIPECWDIVLTPWPLGFLWGFSGMPKDFPSPFSLIGLKLLVLVCFSVALKGKMEAESSYFLLQPTLRPQFTSEHDPEAGSTTETMEELLSLACSHGSLSSLFYTSEL